MKDTDWQILHELYRFRNITKAASALYMTQPALTKRLQVMETEFDIQIVMRGKYGVIFTQAGEYLAKCAEKQVRFMEEVSHKLDYLRNEQKGTLVIGTSYSYSRFQLPELLSRYREMFPGVELELVCVESHKLAQMMELGQLHVCFVRGTYDCGVSQVRLSDEQGYILSRDPVDLERLPELGRIIYDVGSSTRDRVEEWWNERYDRPSKVSMTTTFIDSACQMAKQGMGYTITFLTPEQADELGICKYPLVDKAGKPVKRTTYFLYQEEDNQPDYIRAFIEMVLERV